MQLFHPISFYVAVPLRTQITHVTKHLNFPLKISKNSINDYCKRKQNTIFLLTTGDFFVLLDGSICTGPRYPQRTSPVFPSGIGPVDGAFCSLDVTRGHRNSIVYRHLLMVRVLISTKRSHPFLDQYVLPTDFVSSSTDPTTVATHQSNLTLKKKFLAN